MARSRTVVDLPRYSNSRRCAAPSRGNIVETTAPASWQQPDEIDSELPRTRRRATPINESYTLARGDADRCLPRYLKGQRAKS